MKVPLIGICRHRLTTDGTGVTTLVAFHGCPLHCRYCLNSQCLRPDGVWQRFSVTEILEQVMIDDLYFKATGGGICFGGGEPLLRSDTIAGFCRLCPPEWNIYIETSLNVPLSRLQQVIPFVDHYYVDVKDLSPAIYRSYCQADNAQVVSNLDYLAAQGLQSKVTIRLPLIPDYNEESDRLCSRRQIEQMGFTDFDEFTYQQPKKA